MGDSALSNTASDTINTVWNGIINGGKLVSNVDSYAEDVDIDFSYPEETVTGQLHFKDLRIKFTDVGKYVIIFSVDGIESQPSLPIEVTLPAQTVIGYVKNDLIFFCIFMKLKIKSSWEFLKRSLL